MTTHSCMRCLKCSHCTIFCDGCHCFQSVVFDPKAPTLGLRELNAQALAERELTELRAAHAETSSALKATQEERDQLKSANAKLQRAASAGAAYRRVLVARKLVDNSYKPSDLLIAASELDTALADTDANTPEWMETQSMLDDIRELPDLLKRFGMTDEELPLGFLRRLDDKQRETAAERDTLRAEVERLKAIAYSERDLARTDLRAAHSERDSLIAKADELRAERDDARADLTAGLLQLAGMIGERDAEREISKDWERKCELLQQENSKMRAVVDAAIHLRRSEGSSDPRAWWDAKDLLWDALATLATPPGTHRSVCSVFECKCKRSPPAETGSADAAHRETAAEEPSGSGTANSAQPSVGGEPQSRPDTSDLAPGTQWPAAIGAVAAALPTDAADEAIVDKMLSKATEKLEVRPLKRDGKPWEFIPINPILERLDRIEAFLSAGWPGSWERSGE